MTSLSTLDFDDMSAITFGDIDSYQSVLSFPSLSLESASGDSRISRALVTVFPPDTNVKWLKPETYVADLKRIQNWCGQFEYATTGTLHCHIYVEFTNSSRMRFNTLRKLIEDASGKPGDIKTPRRSSNNQRDCAVNYVLMDSKRAASTDPYVWRMNKHKLEFKRELATKRPKKEAKSDKVEEQRIWIESKPKFWSWDQILHESDESKQLLAVCSWGPKYHAGRVAEMPRRTIDKVIILYGAGGTGKTTIAHKYDMCPDEDQTERYYRRNTDDGHFWGGGRTAYRGQRIIHMEEFCGQEPFHRIKELCDIGKNGPSVNIKGSGTDLNHSTVIFTSNHHPAAWYKMLWSKEQKQFHPFWRRVSQVWFFPTHRADGSPNIPSEDHPPYYIDQTEDWKGIDGSYDTACKHAAKYWPLAETDTSTGVSENYYDPFYQYCRNGNVTRIRGGGTFEAEPDPLISELIGPVEVWPYNIQEILKTEDLKYEHRFKLVIFLLGNGIAPIVFKPWLYSNWHFEIKDKLHIESLIKAYPSSKWTTWNMCQATYM